MSKMTKLKIQKPTHAIKSKMDGRTDTPFDVRLLWQNGFCCGGNLEMTINHFR